jgi:hypothetical protein
MTITYKSYSIRPSKWTWQDYLQYLELRYNDHLNTYNTQTMGINDVNDIMRELYPGPYRVVERYLPDRMVIGFSLEFDDPKEQTFWLLRNS